MPLEREADVNTRAQERRRQVRGLLLIAIVILLLSLWRAGLHNVFTPGWWRLW